MTPQEPSEQHKSSSSQTLDSQLSTEDNSIEQVAGAEQSPAEIHYRHPTILSTFLAALQFLLVTPAFTRRPFSPKEMGKSTGYYPLVGAILGIILLGFNFLLSQIAAWNSSPLPTALTLALWTLLTGALHLDGFLDSCDGLLGGSSPEQRLKIMRDERVGAYALVGGILLLIIKFSALLAIRESSLANIPLALILTPTLGRWGIVVSIVAFPYARSKGLGRDIKDNASWRQALLATLITLSIVIVSAILWKERIGIIAWIAAALTLLCGAYFALRRIPGLTGDVYGALNELMEVVVLLVLSIGR